ncbi:MAG TPA: hypothetical protein VE821_02135, partial [Pyrinomonadaceae bacterium]|nr:hypothetical protein [Pyrinomonadaceae bacterium]
MIASSTFAPPLLPSCNINTASRYSLGQLTQTPNPAAFAGDEATTGKERPRALVVDDAPDVSEMIALLLKY